MLVLNMTEGVAPISLGDRDGFQEQGIVAVSGGVTVWVRAPLALERMGTKANQDWLPGLARTIGVSIDGCHPRSGAFHLGLVHAVDHGGHLSMPSVSGRTLLLGLESLGASGGWLPWLAGDHE